MSSGAALKYSTKRPSSDSPIENSGIDQFELIVLKTAAAILMQQLSVWVCSLGVLIKHFEIGMVWRGVEVVIVFLDIFTVVALAVRKAEQPLF